MPKLSPTFDVICNTITPFAGDGRLDAKGLRAHFGRLADAGCSINLGVSGTGESYYLDNDELEEVYRTGVQICKGKVGAYGIVREGHNAEAVIEVARIAIKAGVDRVHIYGLDMRHNLNPTVAEQREYFREVLKQIDYPIVVAYVPPTEIIEGLCKEFPHIVGVNVGYTNDPVTHNLGEYLDVRDRVWRASPKVKILSSGTRNLLSQYLEGSSGWYSYEANIIPKLSRKLGDHLAARRFEEAADVLPDILRIGRVVMRRAPGSVRAVKTALKGLGLPGGNGKARPPYLPVPQSEARQLLTELEALGIRKLEGLTKKNPRR